MFFAFASVDVNKLKDRRNPSLQCTRFLQKRQYLCSRNIELKVEKLRRVKGAGRDWRLPQGLIFVLSPIFPSDKTKVGCYGIKKIIKQLSPAQKKKTITTTTNTPVLQANIKVDELTFVFKFFH